MSDYTQTRDAAGNVTLQYGQMLRNLDDDLVERLHDRRVCSPAQNSCRNDHVLNQAADRIEELEAKLARAEDERDAAIDTLNAWFDTRKLAHEAIDNTVLDAARGYLRRSRSGGMDQETSDMIEGVITDMARLSVFADLFARAALAELKGQTDE